MAKKTIMLETSVQIDKLEQLLDKANLSEIENEIIQNIVANSII